MRLDIRSVGKKTRTLARGEKIRIGRGPDNDLVLGSIDISRAHAELVWDADEDRPCVVDLSSNGLLFDGELVQERRSIARSGILEIGSFELHLDMVVRREGPGSERFNLHDSSGEFFIDMRGPRIEGRFERPEQLQAILRGIEHDRRTGTFVVEAEDGDPYTITIAKGRAMDSTWKDKDGLEALEHVLRTPSGTYQLTPICRPAEAYLNASFARIIRDL